MEILLGKSIQKIEYSHFTSFWVEEFQVQLCHVLHGGISAEPLVFGLDYAAFDVYVYSPCGKEAYVPSVKVSSICA